MQNVPTNGWSYGAGAYSPPPASVVLELMGRLPQLVSSIEVVTGLGRADHHATELLIELRAQTSDKWTPARLADAPPTPGVVK